MISIRLSVRPKPNIRPKVSANLPNIRPNIKQPKWGKILLSFQLSYQNSIYVDKMNWDFINELHFKSKKYDSQIFSHNKPGKKGMQSDKF